VNFSRIRSFFGDLPYVRAPSSASGSFPSRWPFQCFGDPHSCRIKCRSRSGLHAVQDADLGSESGCPQFGLAKQTINRLRQENFEAASCTLTRRCGGSQGRVGRAAFQPQLSTLPPPPPLRPTGSAVAAALRDSRRRLLRGTESQEGGGRGGSTGPFS